MNKNSRRCRLANSYGSNMKKFIVLILFISISELASGDKCELNFDKQKESKWTKFQRKVLAKLKIDVTTDCESVECKRLDEVETEVEKTTKTGCRCNKEQNVDNKDVYDCRCCFKIKRWNFLICLASALELVDPYKFWIFVTIDGQVISRLNFPLKAIADKYIPVCIPVIFPPPVDWLSPCFKFKFEIPSEANGNTWKLCGKIKVGIYLVPIFTIYTKCFEIGTKKGDKEKIESMKMEGQTKFDEELDKPVKEVKIHDNNNILPMMCVSNKRKARAKDCKGSRAGGGCAKPIQPIEIKEKINWVESDKDLSPFLAYLHTNNQPIPIQKVHEDDGFPFIHETMAELEKEQWMMEVPSNQYNHPGGSCGGALLTNDKLLTVCACVRSFYKVNKWKKELDDDDEDFLFDMPSSTEIFVRFAGPSVFRDMEEHRLDPDGNKMIGMDSECAQGIRDKKPGQALLGSMIVMPFTPKVVSTKVPYVFWPPGVLKADQTVSLVAYGMETQNPAWFFKSSSGEKIDFHTTAVDFFLKQCDMTQYCKELTLQTTLSGPIKDRLKCMCAANKGFQLIDGEIGFPLTFQRKLLGLASLPIDSGVEGSTAGVVFDAKTIKEIETYVGKDNLHAGCSNLSQFYVHYQLASFIAILYC